MSFNILYSRSSFIWNLSHEYSGLEYRLEEESSSCQITIKLSNFYTF